MNNEDKYKSVRPNQIWVHVRNISLVEEELLRYFDDTCESTITWVSLIVTVDNRTCDVLHDGEIYTIPIKNLIERIS